jgi:hypothetical protein
MSKGKNKNSDIKRRGQFIPWFVETTDSPAWKAMSMGARVLYMALKRHHFVGFNNNNGRIFLSGRDAMEEIGVGNRDSIHRWFRELQHYGFIVMTSPGSLGLDGKGKAPQWRLTELETPLADTKEPTLDYLKWDGTPFNGNQAWRGRGPKPKKQNPGRETTSRVAAKQRPVLAAKQRPPQPGSGRETTSISAPHPGRETRSISRLTTRGVACLPDDGTVQAKLPWGAPMVIEVTDPEEAGLIRQQCEAIGWRRCSASGPSGG